MKRPTNTLDDDAMTAAIELVGRAGARSLSVGYLHDDVPAEQAAWWAHAQYGGARITVENHTGPTEALEALAERILTGGKCAHCGRITTLRDDGGIVFPSSRFLDGTTTDLDEARRVGFCRWRREGPRWVQGCVAHQKPEP